MSKYLLIGGIAILLIGSFALLRSQNPETTETESVNGFTPVSSLSHSHGIAVDVSDASRVYIATHEGLHVLQNGTGLFRVGNTQDDLMGFSPHPTNPNIFFSSGHPARGGNIGFQKSTDGGVTWERVSAGLNGPVDFHSMTVSTANPDNVYGFFGGRLQRSTDSGASWEYANGTVAPLSLSTHPANPDVVYAATQNGVQMSEDKGDSWKSLSPELDGGAVSLFVLHPDDAQYALTFSERLGGLGKSTNGGMTWERISETFGGDTVLYLSFSKSEPDVVYALTNTNSVYKSTDRGNIWAKVL